MTTIDLRGLTKVEIAEKMMEVNTRETAGMLFEIYHRFINDMLDVEYLEELGYRFGVDLREQYIQASIEDEDEGEEV